LFTVAAIVAALSSPRSPRPLPRVSGQAGAIHHSVRTGRRVRRRRAAAGTGVPGEIQAGDDRDQQARRGRRARLVADEQHAGGRLHVVGVNLPHIVLQPLEPDASCKTEDITPVYFFHYTPDAIIVAADSPFKTFADLVRAAREKPESVTIAGSGTNSANHVATVRLDRR
jgi:hypothetical protein